MKKQCDAQLQAQNNEVVNTSREEMKVLVMTKGSR